VVLETLVEGKKKNKTAARVFHFLQREVVQSLQCLLPKYLHGYVAPKLHLIITNQDTKKTIIWWLNK